jgi:hypothetical protein
MLQLSLAAESINREENMSTALADLSGLLKGIPSGAWVAISEKKRKVLAYGPDPQEVLRAARESGEEHPLLLRVPDQATAMFF